MSVTASSATLFTGLDLHKRSVFDVLGRLVYTTERIVTGDGQVEFDAAGWPSGLYVVRLASASRVATTRFVVQ